jgi:hypothetical protein
MRVDPDLLLLRLMGGPFDEPARSLRDALANGAQVHLSTRAIPSSELRDTYQLRRKHLAAANRRMPGFDLVAELFIIHPGRSWWFVGIHGGRFGGLLVLSEDQEPAACFAYTEST